MSNHHAVKNIKAADGGSADIDVMLADLIEALWDAGYETIGSCQDLGESISAVSERKSDYWSGYALVEMPVEDTLRLLDAVEDSPQFQDRMHWAAPGAWEVSLPVLSSSPWGEGADVMPWAQIHFPNDQIDDLIKVITGL